MVGPASVTGTSIVGGLMLAIDATDLVPEAG